MNYSLFIIFNLILFASGFYFFQYIVCTKDINLNMCNTSAYRVYN